MVAQAEGHRRAGSAPHTEVGPVRPSPLIRRGGKWRGEETNLKFGTFKSMDLWTEKLDIPIHGTIIGNIQMRINFGTYKSMV